MISAQLGNLFNTTFSFLNDLALKFDFSAIIGGLLP